jgi:hypothetical protein
MPSTDPRSTRRFSAKSLAMAGLFALAFTIAGCSGAGAGPQNVGDNLGGAPGEQPGDGSGSGDQGASLTDRKIIKTGEISLEVPDVARALARVRALALELGGYVGGSQSGTFDQSATLTLRIPADRFEDALARLHELDGDVLNEATREEDVTSTVVDLEARLRNLQASETQYRMLLGQAVKVEDILAVQTRLDDVRGQIEQLQAQHKELTGLADLATLSVTLVPGAVQQAAGNWDPGKTVTEAFAALVGFVQDLGNAGIWLVIVILPALILLAIVAWLLLRLVPGLRSRLGRAPKE